MAGHSVGHPEIDVYKLFNYKLWKLWSLAGAPVVRLCEGRYGVSRQEWSLLAVVAGDGQVSPSQLAAQIALDRPRASKVVAGLIGKGLLRRLQAHGESRRFLLELTPEGLQLVQNLYPDVRAVSEAVLAGLEPPERAQFVALLDKLIVHAAQVNASMFPQLKANRRRAPALPAEPGAR